MSKDVAILPEKLSSAALATRAADYGLDTFKDIKLDITENKELFSNDILIPKIWLVQEISDLRKAGKAKAGELVDSQSEELLAGIGEKLRFVVLKTFKRWHTFEAVQKNGKEKLEFISSEVMVFGKNHDYKYEDILEGKKIKRRQVISAYVIIEKDAIKGVNKPYVIDFAASSKFGGRVMVSDIATLNKANLPSFAGFFEMCAENVPFDEGEAFVKKVKFCGYTGKEAIPFLIGCYKDIEVIENQIVIDDSDVIKSGGSVEGEVVKNVNNKADVASTKI